MIKACVRMGQLEFKGPTGCGKTVSMVVAGRVMLDHGASKIIYTTPLVALVSQLRDVKAYGIPTLVGKRNYPCLLHEGMTADDCPFKANDIGDPDICPACPYRQAKVDFLLTRYGATTMARFLFDPGARKNADVVMIDESATAEDALLKACMLKLPEKLDLSNGLLDAVIDWSTEMDIEAQRLGDEYMRMWTDAKKRPSLAQLREMQKTSKIIKALERDSKKCEKILHIINSKQKYIVDKDLCFKVVHGGRLFQEMAKQFKLVVLASGTPTTHLICDDYKTVLAPHPIDVSRRRVYACQSVGKMSSACRRDTAPAMAKMIVKLHNKWHQHTIVHCGNYETMGILFEILQTMDCRVINHTPQTRSEQFDLWKNTPDSIFLAVAFTNGIDLPGNEYPLGILANLPFPAADEWVMARKAYDDGKHYNTMVAVDVQQAAGRCTRSPDDYSQFWILDKNFVWFYKRNPDLFEPWFKEAVMFVH
jgi:Rad3-related DNA helicase